MRNRLKYTVIAGGSLIACVIIALMFNEMLFIRGFIGDLLVVIFIYCAIKMFADIKAIILSCAVLLFSFMVEFLQLFNFIELIGLQNNRYARVIIGATFDYRDLIAYLIGIIIIYIIDTKILSKRSGNNLLKQDS